MSPEYGSGYDDEGFVPAATTPMMREDAPDVSAFESIVVLSNRQPYRHEFVDRSAAAECAVVEEHEGETARDSAGEVMSVSARTDSARAQAEPHMEGGATVVVDRPTGGLIAGLDPVVQRTGGTWIAWGDGEADELVTDEGDCVAVPPEEPRYNLARIWLDEGDVETYYNGFSNRVLWPVCHDRVDLMTVRPADFDGYRAVNRRFATAAAAHAAAGSLVWTQDYHLALAPAMIRERVPSSVTLGHFWHIPWPSPETFEACPYRRDLVAALLANDVLGFHTHSYVRAFLETVEHELPDATVDYDRSRVRYCGTDTRVLATPMGIDATAYDRESREVTRDVREKLRQQFGLSESVTVLSGVDRLDYAKGIPKRLAALERLFERWPSLRESVTLVQSVSPSRTEISAYREHASVVHQRVDTLNDRFGTRTWTPVRYSTDYLSRTELCGLYQLADVMIVSSHRDGMNLVAQEYVAASVDGTGALCLSDRTGFHDVAGESAYSLDPARTDQFAEQIHAAIEASPTENRRRMATLRRRVFTHDLEWWLHTQLSHFAACASSEHVKPDQYRDSTGG